MGKFGWSYPAGCNGPPDFEGQCPVCGLGVGQCVCPVCPVCKVQGDPKCYQKHGLQVMSVFRYFRLMGRGADQDFSPRYHALAPGDSKALCGAEPGHRSPGWSSWESSEPTCLVCIRLIKIFEKATAGLSTPSLPVARTPE